MCQHIPERFVFIKNYLANQQTNHWKRLKLYLSTTMTGLFVYVYFVTYRKNIYSTHLSHNMVFHLRYKLFKFTFEHKTYIK